MKRQRIVLVSCASKKLADSAKAKDLYISPLFKLNLQYAQKLESDSNIFILSAKHGLLQLDKVIDPYEKTLTNMRVGEIKIWAKNVLFQLQKICNVTNTEFIFLAGEKYRRYLLNDMNRIHIPLNGLGIGEQLQKLKELISQDQKQKY